MEDTKQLQRSCEAEVVRLHRFFSQWFNGEIDDSAAGFAPLEQSLSPDFEIVVPQGRTLDRQTLVASLRSAYGRDREDPSAIEIRNSRARTIAGGLLIVCYEEWQEHGESQRGRQSTAILRPEADSRFEWLHVHETWLSED